MKTNKIQMVYSLKSLAVSLQTMMLISSMLLVSSAKADDTEVFYTESEINNNVLFIMDNSGSMKEEVAGTTSTGDSTSVSSPIINNDEDADEHITGSRGTSHGGSILEMTQDGLNTQIVGMRFRNLDIPKGAVIDSAYIQFTSTSNSSTTTTLDIKVQSDSNRPTFGTNKTNISSRNLYSTKVTWDPDPWSNNQSGAAQQTPDLKSLIQLMVDRSDWENNDPIVFVVSGTGSRRPASKNNGDGSKSPVLHVTYEEVGGQKTRMKVMQDALRTVLDNAPDNLSVGIMNYGDNVLWRDKNKPNGVKFPVTAVNSLARPIIEESMELDGSTRWDLSNIPEPSETVTVRTFLSEIADDWQPKGMTPIVDALYEASLYYRGEALYYGYDRTEKRRKWAAHPSTYAGEPTTDTSTVEVCEGTPRVREVWGPSNIANWDNGNGNENCPSNLTSPYGPGSKANCAATKHACELNHRQCNSGWVSGRNQCTTTGTDEDGNPIQSCTWIPGYCPGNDWGPPGSNAMCKYRVCRNKWEQIPPPKYVSPMQDGCQSNFMILMSDGKPEYSNGVNRDPNSYSKVKSFLNKSSCDITFGFRSGRCGADLTHYLATNDNSTGPDGVDGNQFLHTYVIGFSEGITMNASRYLQSLVTLEDNPDTPQKEGYFSATNEAELADAFAQALDEIAEEARSQASPGYSVNVKSGLEHEKDIYIPVFDKKSSSTWSGNLKKFKIVDENGERKIRGKVTQAGSSTGAGYVDAMTELGLFKEDAWDEFSNSATADGNNVEKGGTAALLNDPRKRKIYTNVFSNNIYQNTNIMKSNNKKITEEMLFDNNEHGFTKQEAKDYREKLINFIRGWIDGEDGGWGDGIGNGFPEGNIPSYSRRHMGDMLHSEPVILTYTKATDTTAKTQYIFAATNEGYLHAFNSTSGEEQFAFMPKELFKNIESQLTGQGPHLYGIDGSISYWHKDINKDGNVNGSDKVYLYFGMRRGGRSYYALDVTDIDQPKLKWVVNNGDTGLARLGQSWSMPYIARIKHNDVKKEVIVFTAGHDPELDYGNGDDYDPISVKTDKLATSMGDDIFILDADNGNLLWSMRQTVGKDVKHGLPGGVRILDVNRNGLLDRMYFADTGGNVWRLDMDEGLSSDADDYDLTKFASLGGSGVNSRKFYNEPDVAQLRARGRTMFSVSVGSGLRPHPMNEEINDHMFVLLDETPLDKLPDDFKTIKFIDKDLSKVTIGVSAGTKSVTKSTDFEGNYITEVQNDDESYKRGWYVDFFEDGEKVLAQSITFEGSLIFTTLVPKSLTQGELINACAAPATQGRLYAMNILTGEASIDTSKDLTIDDNDVFDTISASEIPGTPQRVFNELKCDPTVNGVNGECKHPVDIRIGKKSSQVGQDDVANIESIYWSDPSN